MSLVLGFLHSSTAEQPKRPSGFHTWLLIACDFHPILIFTRSTNGSNSHPTPSSFSPHTANTWGIYTGWCIPCHQHTLPDHRSESSNKLNNHLVPRAVCFTHHQDGYLSASLAARGPASEIPLHPLAFLAYIHAQRLGSLEDVKMKFRVQTFFRDEYLWKDEGQK